MSRSFDLKLERAYEHLKSFESEADTWIKTEPYGLIDEQDPESSAKQIPDGYLARRFRINRVSSVPDRLGLIIGDCVFNLRATLDHLAMSLAQAFTSSMTDGQVAGSEFPVFGPHPMDTRTETKKIGCVDPKAVAIIKKLQPHHRGNAYAAHPLWQIHDLNRIDKHRALVVCGVTDRLRNGKRVVHITDTNDENIADRIYWKPGTVRLELDAILVRWAGKPIDPNREMRMKPTISIQIAFDQRGSTPPVPVIPTLEALCQFVGDVVIPQLSTFL